MHKQTGSSAKVERSPVVNGDVNPTRLSDDELGEAVVEALRRKGFCVIPLGLSINLIEQALSDIVLLDSGGGDRLQQPGQIIAEGLLGEEGSARICELDWLNEDIEGDRSPSALSAVDSVASEMFCLMAPHIGRLNISPDIRTRGIVMETCTRRLSSGLTPQPLDRDVANWFQIFAGQTLMSLVFLGPAEGKLELRPFREECARAHTIVTQPGTMVFLRADMLLHEHTAPAKVYSVGCYFLQDDAGGPRSTGRPQTERLSPAMQKMEDYVQNRLHELKTQELNGTLDVSDIPDCFRLAMNRIYTKTTCVNVCSVGVRIPLGWGEHSPIVSSLCGADCAVEVPRSRWDNSLIYRPEALDDMGWTGGTPKAVGTKHGGFMDGIELFDSRIFAIAQAEAKAMCPEQRMNLELGYECLYRAGFRKTTLMNSTVGVFSGNTTSDWGSVPKESRGAFAAASHTSIHAPRLNFCLGMRGPAIVVDQECSSGLVAVCLGSQSFCDAKTAPTCKTSTSVVLAIHLNLWPRMWGADFLAGLLCPAGRAFAFDISASGYARGEGCAAMVLRPAFEHTEAMETIAKDPDLTPVGSISGKAMLHSGASSSMGAPCGPALQEVLHQAVRDAGISPCDVDVAECHGACRNLHDPVEVYTLADVMRGSLGGDTFGDPLRLTCLKTNTLNSLENHGLTVLVRALVATQWGVTAPMAHLRVCNHNIEFEHLADQPVILATESLELRELAAFASTRSSSIGGMHCSVVCWGAVDQSHVLSAPSRTDPKELLSFWPAGGGELAEFGRYEIAGSWSRWKVAEPMKMEAAGVYTYIVTIGENGCERFQIWLDGSQQRVLHPDTASAPRFSPVCCSEGALPGGSKESLAWCIGGHHGSLTVPAQTVGARQAAKLGPGGEEVRARPLLAGLSDGADESVPEVAWLPGDQCKVTLQVAGKWRLVTWEKLATCSGSTSVSSRSSPAAGSYALAGSWNNFELEEMTPEADVPGLFHIEVGPLVRGRGEFLIVRNEDWNQVFHPALSTCSPGSMEVLGPVDASDARLWILSGRIGDVFRVEFCRSWQSGSDCKQISWELLRGRGRSSVPQAAHQGPS